MMIMVVGVNANQMAAMQSQQAPLENMQGYSVQAGAESDQTVHASALVPTWSWQAPAVSPQVWPQQLMSGSPVISPAIPAAVPSALGMDSLPQEYSNPAWKHHPDTADRKTLSRGNNTRTECMSLNLSERLSNNSRRVHGSSSSSNIVRSQEHRRGSPRPSRLGTNRNAPPSMLQSAGADAAGGCGGGSLIEQVAGRVWKLSQDPQGCREVQQAIEEATDDRTRSRLAKELFNHIWEAARCPYSNFVVQKLIMTVRPHSSQFIVDEILAKGTVDMARHKYGCRILQRLLEHCPPQQLRGLVQQLLDDAVGLSKHTYGNYVIQHLIEHGAGDYQNQLAVCLLRHATELGADPNGCAVLGKELSLGRRDIQANLASILCSVPGLLMKMSHTRYGHATAKLALQQAQRPCRDRARHELIADIAALRSTRYGRSVAAFLEASAAAGGA